MLCPQAKRFFSGNMMFSQNSVILAVISILITPALAQYDCDKYCFESCSKYFPGPEFSPCVDANVHCSCQSKPSLQNPFMIFILIVIVMVIVFISCVCYQKCARGRIPRSAVVAHPVVPTVYGNYNNPGANYAPTTYPTTASPTPHFNALPVAPPAPYSSSQYPPAEYLPPPPYNECATNPYMQK